MVLQRWKFCLEKVPLVLGHSSDPCWAKAEVNHGRRETAGPTDARRDDATGIWRAGHAMGKRSRSSSGTPKDADTSRACAERCDAGDRPGGVRFLSLLDATEARESQRCRSRGFDANSRSSPTGRRPSCRSRRTTKTTQLPCEWATPSLGP